MRVLIGCEVTGTVREAFASLGHDAWSCDILPSEIEGKHIQDDILTVIGRGHWDLLIAHPPCTDLAVSGARWFERKGNRPELALELVRQLILAPIKRIAIENPISIISSRLRKPDQIIQPWEFGHGESKATCLWLKNLPKLRPTNVVEACVPIVHRMAPSVTRAADRAKTYPGIATAMATQWGVL